MLSAVMCLLAAPRVWRLAGSGNRWSHNVPQHKLMTISCHFRNFEAFLVMSLTRINSAISSTGLLSYTVHSREKNWISPATRKAFMVRVLCSVCPSHCYKCSQRGGVISCDDKMCHRGYARAADGTCQSKKLLPHFAFVALICCWLGDQQEHAIWKILLPQQVQWTRDLSYCHNHCYRFLLISRRRRIGS